MPEFPLVGPQDPSTVQYRSQAASTASAAKSPPVPIDRVERAHASAGGPSHGLGAGILAGASIEAGLFRGLGASASVGAGVFSETGRSLRAGSFASAGAFADINGRSLKTAPSADPVNVVGAFAGAGVGAFVTNAGSAEQLSGIAQTYSVNVGVGPLKVSVQLGASDGTYVGSVSVGPGFGLDVSRYPNQTAARSW